MKAPAPSERIWAFGSALRNASRAGVYADLILEMYESGDWRRYQTLQGVDEWRAHEFDYFLIAHEADYRDVHRILGWKTILAAKVAAAMRGPEGPDRRSLADASTAWHNPARTPLLQLAQWHGWMRKDGTRVIPVVGSRIMARIDRPTITPEVHAQQRRQRRLKTQLPALNARVTALIAETPDVDALRYILEQLRRYLRGRRHSDHAQWKRDVQAVKGNRAKLAARWGVTPKTTHKRMERTRRHSSPKNVAS